MPAAPAPITHAPPILWAAARALITTIFALFGDPGAIAAQQTHRQSERALILKWLRAGEALMRHLLLIEAAQLAPGPGARPPRRAPRQRVRRLMTFTADKPEAWRVSFRCFASAMLRQAQHDAEGGVAGSVSVSLSLSKAKRPEASLHSAWPLAERAEALLRAFNDPAPYARRLARRLRAAPQRTAALTRHPPNLAQVIAEPDFALLRAHAARARQRFDSG